MGSVPQVRGCLYLICTGVPLVRLDVHTADHEQDWQPYRLIYTVICDDHACMYTAVIFILL